MRDAPPPALVELLGRLGLAVPAQVLAVQKRVRRLTRGLPGFEQVWVDALAQARVLTPFQAGEINAGRADALAVAPYVLVHPLETLGYGVAYRAREIASGREVRVTVVPATVAQREAWSPPLATLMHKAALVQSTNIESIDAYGFDTDRLWTAATMSAGQSAAERMLHHGRFSPAAVEEIARQMTAGLAACETAGVVHGDISARQLWLEGGGQVKLVGGGLRGIVLPGESYAHADRIPDGYDYLAPERIADGTPPTLASDIYACGALWWHLLAGRPPIPGCTGLAKMQAIQTAKIVDIAQLAPDCSPALADLVRACMQRDPRRRPQSFAELSARQTPSSSTTQRALARYLDQSRSCRLRLGQAPEARSFRGRARRATAIAVGCALVIVAGTWPQWQPRLMQAVGTSPKTQVVASSSVKPASVAPATPTALGAAASTQTSEPAAASVRRRPGPWKGSQWQEDELVLDASSPVAVVDIPLKPGQVIRAEANRRATIHVPAEGWRVETDEVRFHNVDFVATSPETPAIIAFVGRRAEFHGCSWQGVRSDSAVAAVHWSEPLTASKEEFVLSGEIRFCDCLMQDVGAGVLREGRGSVLVESVNVLHLGPGSLVELTEAPQADESLELIASHVTLRDASSLLMCRYSAMPTEPGRLVISAKDCAFMPRSGSGVVVFSGSAQPAALLKALEWTGQGSVLSQNTPMAVWRDAAGMSHAASDEAVHVAGLVRSEVGFAGEKTGGSSASRIVRWQVPLESTEPPGIRDSKPFPPGALR